MSLSRPFKTAALIALLLFCARLSFAQSATTAGLYGNVKDSKGNSLPAATVLAIHVPTGMQYGTTARNDGNYNVFNLTAGGPYTIKVSFVGYSTQTIEDVYFQLAQNFKMDFSLTEETIGISEVTVISDKSAIINQTRTGAFQNVTAKQIEEIPTISRRFQDFSKLSPQFSGNSLNAAGRNSKFNNIQIDGAQHNDLFGLGSSGTPGGQASTNPISLETIQEFQVVIAPYDIKYGGFTGGGINAITRSGTNSFHGSVYSYWRNQELMGESPTEYNKTKLPKFYDAQYGFRVGGPIVKDQLFFFVSGEMTDYSRPLSNASIVNNPTNLTLAERMDSILTHRYGLNVGSVNTIDVLRPSTKLFARLDWNISQEHKLTLRHNFVDATDDVLGSRTANNTMSFDSYKYLFENNTNSSVIQLRSSIGNNMSNELILGYTRIRDNRGPEGDPLPQIRVRLTGMDIYAGTEMYSSANSLDQDIFEVTNNFTYLTGNHILTFGTHNEFFSFRNLYIRAFYGAYEFNSLDNLLLGRTSSYQMTYSRIPGVKEPAAEFSVNQFGVYVQDEWMVLPQLRLTLGARLDIPTIPEAPAYNDSVTRYYPDYRTDNVPKSSFLFSPRLGFNYDVMGDRSTILRGGAGIFSGRISYVWMSNNYGNTGLMIGEVRGSNFLIDTVTGYKPFDPYNPPGVGFPGTGAPNFRSEINLVDPDFKMPQLLRFNLALDRQLPFDFVGTVEFIYSKTINDLIYKYINLRPAIDTLPDGRYVWGGANSHNNNFTEVMYLTNTSDGYQTNLTFQLQRNMLMGLSANLGYTYGKAEDRNSIASSQARSQMRYNPIDVDPNEPKLTTSLWEVKHRIFASISYKHEFIPNWLTTISLFYNGQSGQPFSYIVAGDANGDGFDYNDLFYVPKDNSDILLGTVVSGAYVPANQQMYDDLNAFIDNDEYLKDNRGKMTERNGAKNPWETQLDLRIAQDIPIIPGHRFQLTFDVLNVLNLLDNDWGWNESVYSTYQLIKYEGRVNGQNIYSFKAPTNNSPFTANDISSRWAVQIGARYTF